MGHHKNLWIFGPPGAGKTFLAKYLQETFCIPNIIDSDDEKFIEDVQKFKSPYSIAFGLLREVCTSEQPCILTSVGAIPTPETLLIGLTAPLSVLLARKPGAYAHWQMSSGNLGDGSVDKFEGFACADLVLDGTKTPEENTEQIRKIWSPNG